MICIAEGGTEIERWAPPSELSRRCQHTFSVGGGELYAKRVQPLSPMPIKGVLWHQGEFNLRTNAISGNSEGGSLMGY